MGHIIIDRFHVVLRVARLSKTSIRDDFCLALYYTGRCRLDDLRMKLPHLSKLAVYRTLNFMLAAGLVERFGDDTYDLREPLRQHRHYLNCENCERVVPFNDDNLEKAISELSSRRKMNIKSHQVELVGLCGRCDTKDK